MSSIAKLSNGTLLQMGDGASPEVFTTIPEVMKISGPSVDFDLIDVSSHSSPDLFKEYIPGWSDGEVIAFQYNFRTSNTVHQNIRTNAYNATKTNFKVVFPDTPLNTVKSATYVKNNTPTADAGKQMLADGRLKVTGAPIWS